MKRTKRKKSLYWRVRSPFVAILLVVSMLAEIAITVQAAGPAATCECNICVTQEIACEQCADCLEVAKEESPSATTEEPTEGCVTKEREIAIGKEEPKKTEETKETKVTKEAKETIETKETGELKETKEPRGTEVTKEAEETGEPKEDDAAKDVRCPIQTQIENRGKPNIRYGYFTPRGRAAVNELIGGRNRGADFARNLSRAQLGIDQELTYVVHTDVSLGADEVFPVEGITVAIPAPNVVCGETVVVLHFIESQGVWEALSGVVANEVVFVHLMSFSPVVVYLVGTPWAKDVDMSGALSAIPADAVRLNFTDNSPNGKTVLEHAFMSVNDNGSISMFFLVSSNQKQLPLVMSYAGYGGWAIGQIGNNNDCNNVMKYVAYRVDIVLDGIRDISSGIVDISTGQGGHTINGGRPITFTNMTVQVHHYRMDVDVEGVPYRVTYETGGSGAVVTGRPISIYGYEYSQEDSKDTAGGIIPFNGTLVLKLYYKRDLEGSSVILIEGPHVSIPYDGNAHSLEEIAGKLYTITFPGAGYSIVGEAAIQATNPQGRDIGRYEGEITLGQNLKILYDGPRKDAEVDGSEDVTDYVTIIRKAGSLTITPSNEEIVITAGSAAKAYDGEPLTSNVIIYPEPPAGATHITAEVEGSQTEIGFSPNRIVKGSVRIWRNEEDVTKFFANIETVDGELRVTMDTEASITIWAESAGKRYDGKALTETGFDHSPLPKGISKVEATVVGSQTNAGKSSNVIEKDGYKLFDETGNEVTESFPNVTLLPGTLEVLPRPAMVMANSGTKKAATEDPADLLGATTEAFNRRKGTGFLVGEEPAPEEYLLARVPGEASGKYKVDFVKDTITYNNSNYKVTWMPGDLVIEANLDETHEDFFEVTITANSHISVYDGNVKVAEGVKEIINPNNDLEVEFFSLAAKGVKVLDSTAYLPNNANQIVVYGLTYKGFTLKPEDVVVHVEDGILEIQPALVTITALSDIIVLGEAIPPLRHMIEGIPVKGDDLIHTVDYLVAHVDLKNAVGIYPIEVTVLAEANPNYIIEVVHGQLVIWIKERKEEPTVTPPPEDPPETPPENPPEKPSEIADPPDEPKPPEISIPREVPNPPEVTTPPETTTPEDPTVPTPPETPATPEDPTVPTPPETPTTPEDPTVPTPPETPTTPENPTVPAPPETPTTPENPTVSRPPETTTTPEEPTVPAPREIPTTPGVPTTPTPTVPVTPPVTIAPEPTGFAVRPPQIIETPAPSLPPPEEIVVPVVNEDGTITYATIPNDEVPLAAPPMPLHWALVNLLLTILTVIIMLLLMITYITKKRDEKEGDKRKGRERDEAEVKRKGFFRLAAVVIAIVSIVVFILTEDMRLPMVLVDRWTLLMAIIALIQVVVALISKKKYVKAEATEEVEEQMA